MDTLGREACQASALDKDALRTLKPSAWRGVWRGVWLVRVRVLLRPLSCALRGALYSVRCGLRGAESQSGEGVHAGLSRGASRCLLLRSLTVVRVVRLAAKSRSCGSCGYGKEAWGTCMAGGHGARARLFNLQHALQAPILINYIRFKLRLHKSQSLQPRKLLNLQHLSSANLSRCFTWDSFTASPLGASPGTCESLRRAGRKA
jgi:hypothetical protein